MYDLRVLSKCMASDSMQCEKKFHVQLFHCRTTLSKKRKQTI